MNKSYVYIMSNKVNSVLYVGVTTNLRQRVIEHKSREIESFTQRYFCDKLLYFEEFSDIRDAIAREKQLKNWRREWKDDLIRGINPDFVDLSL